MVPTESASLAPGFRFHPTDEELVRYYLRRKIFGKPFRFDAISDIDIYKAEPWELPGQAKLKTRDLEWYFFSVLDKKYGNGSRTNRATEKGYWKTTGKDRAVYHRTRVVGMKKTLVYHSGRAPRGQRTNWVMHEYRLFDEELEKAGIVQDAFVLCRIFQKSGPGPKNGEQYGAPFVEEEWEEDELDMVPKGEATDEVEFGENGYLDETDVEQILTSGIPPQIAAPFNYYGGDATFVQETTESNDDPLKILVGTEECHTKMEQSDNQGSFHLPDEYDVHQPQVKYEYIGESSKTVISEGIDETVNSDCFLLDEPFMDALDNLPFDEAFLETNDLANPVTDDMLHEYLSQFDANGESLDFNAFDLPEVGDYEDFTAGQASLAGKDVKDGVQPLISNQQLLDHDDNVPSTNQEPRKYGTDFPYPFIKQASHMLGSFPAPPAFASEFPSKDAIHRLNSASQPSSSAHVTAGMIHISKTNLAGHEADWFSGKLGQYNITLSFGLSRGEDNSTTLESVVRILPGKTVSAVSNGWFYFLFFWILLLFVSFKVGTFICAR